MTKNLGEKIIQESNLQHLILRIDQPYNWKDSWHHTNSVLRIIDTLMMKRPEATAGVVEHTIQNDPHVAFVRGIQQPPQRVVATQQRIDIEVIVRVIAMVGGRAEHGCLRYWPRARTTTGALCGPGARYESERSGQSGLVLRASGRRARVSDTG